MILRRWCIPCVLGLACSIAIAQQSLTNDAVTRMAKAGLSDDLIIQTINSQPSNFQTGANDLVALKQAGLSDRVIGAMLSPHLSSAGAIPTAAGSAPAGAAVDGVDEIGVYYKDRSGKWVQMLPEIINFKSGGFLKSVATNGIVKQDQNGHLDGETAKLQVSKPVEFLIYTPEGTAPNEYQLLKLRVSKNTREFRSSTGGVFHTSTGATRDAVEISPTKVAPRRYTFSLDAAAAPGEYGVLPPGAVATANAASGGKLYTFHVIE